MKHWHSPHGTPLPAYQGRTLLMGILNVTPDSFSDGGQHRALEAALAHAERMIEEGVHLIDIGGESTRPGSEPVPGPAERERVIPVIEALRRKHPDLPLSIDTSKAEVADAALRAGADLVNDVWGFRSGVDPNATRPHSPMAEVVARWQCPAILMHNRTEPVYADFWSEVLEDLRFSLRLATEAGSDPAQLWVDPGFGFGKTPAHNLEILKHLDRLQTLGLPILLGTSRKSTLGLVLNRPVEDRLEGTLATNLWGLAKGANMLRVHEVGIHRPYVQMTDAIQDGLNFVPATPSAS